MASLAETNLAIGKEKKDAGDQAFRGGDIKQALLAYHQAIMYLQGIDKQALPGIGSLPTPPKAEGDDSKPAAGVPETRTEADEMVEKIYSNMSACHMKNGNWKRALDCAERALKKNPNNDKAMFRKGKALGELGWIERAEKVLSDLKARNPSDTQLVEQELAKMKLQDAERERKANQKFRGFLSRDKKDSKDAEKAKSVKSAIPTHVRPEEDGDGRSSDQPILIPSGIEEIDDDNDE